MLTVKQLIEKLKSMPEDAPVFVYAGCDVEGDGYCNDVVLCNRDSVDDYQMTEYYCNGDSIAAIHMLYHPDLKEIVVIGNDIYEEEKE